MGSKHRDDTETDDLSTSEVADQHMSPISRHSMRYSRRRQSLNLSPTLRSLGNGTSHSRTRRRNSTTYGSLEDDQHTVDDLVGILDHASQYSPGTVLSQPVSPKSLGDSLPSFPSLAATTCMGMDESSACFSFAADEGTVTTYNAKTPHPSPAKHYIPDNGGIDLAQILINTDDPSFGTVWIKSPGACKSHLELNIARSSPAETRVDAFKHGKVASSHRSPKKSRRCHSSAHPRPQGAAMVLPRPPIM